MAELCPPITDVVEATERQRLFAAVWPGDGPTLVFLPGLTSTHRAFAGVAAMLEGRFGVVALDLRGRGNSPKPPAGSYGIARHADDVLAVLDRIGVDRAIIVGHSMGAYVATAVATTAPQRASALVLLDGGVVTELQRHRQRGSTVIASARSRTSPESSEVPRQVLCAFRRCPRREPMAE